MSALNLNKVILVGRLTSDPEQISSSSGVVVCHFSIAVNRAFSREKEGAVDYIPCVAFRKTAEIVGKYFTKGKSICVIGQIQSNKYTTQSGETRTKHEVVADEVKFVDSAGEGGYESRASYDAPSFAKRGNDSFIPLPEDADLPF